MEKKKILLILLGVIIGVVLTLVTIKIVSFVNSNGNLGTDDCVGTWEIFEFPEGDISKYYMPTIEIYKGGTAKGSDRTNENAYHPFNWEIKDDILVLTDTLAGTSKSYEIDGDLMKAADGSVVFKKIHKD